MMDMQRNDYKYPILHERRDRRRKLMSEDIKNIRQLRSIGWSYDKLARKYNVVRNTIQRYCDDSFAERMAQKNKERSREYRKSNPLEAAEKNKKALHSHYLHRKKEKSYFIYRKVVQSVSILKKHAPHLLAKP